MSGRPTAEGCQLLATTGLLLGLNGDYDTATSMLNDAQAVAEELADGRLLGQVLCAQVNLYHAYSEYEQAVQAGERAAAELRRAGDLWELASVLGFVDVDLTYVGRLGEVATCDDELRRIADRLGHHGALMMSDSARSSRDLMRTADLDAVEAVAKHGLEAWQRAGPFSWAAYCQLGTAQFWRGQWQEALASFERATHPEPLPEWVDLVWGWLFLLKAYAGDADALQVFANKRRRALPSPDKPNFAGGWHFAQLAAEGLAVVGARRDGHALHATLLRAMEMRACGAWVGLVPTTAGIAAACGADWTAAEQHFQTALRQAHEIPHKIAQPETRRWYAQMLLDRKAPGDRERARTLLGEAIEMYRTIGMPKHLELAERMRERL